MEAKKKPFSNFKNAIMDKESILNLLGKQHGHHWVEAQIAPPTPM